MRHLHRVRAANQLEHLIDDDRHDHDVDDVPEGDRRALQQIGEPGHSQSVRSSPGRRRAGFGPESGAAIGWRRRRATTCTISATRCTRTMCAPARTAAVTAAAVAQSRSAGGRAPDRGRQERLARGTRRGADGQAPANASSAASTAKLCAACLAKPSPGSTIESIPGHAAARWPARCCAAAPAPTSMTTSS